MERSATGRAKARLAAGARRRPRVAARLATILRSLRLGAQASRLERAADLARIVPPPPARPFHLLRCGGQDQVARDAADLGWNAFETPLPAVLAALITTFCRHGRFADVGANTGYYAMLAAASEPTVAVDAFEPYPPVLDLLRRNRAINGAGRVTVHGVALGSAPGAATLYVPLADHGLIETSSSLSATFDATRIGQEITVEVSTLDACYPDGDRAPRLLKIDVESLEPDVLEGGERLLAGRQPLLVLELLPHEDPGRLEALRDRYGYVAIRLRPASAVVGGPVRPDPEAWNHLWCAPGDLDEVTALLRRVGLDVRDAADG